MDLSGSIILLIFNVIIYSVSLVFTLYFKDESIFSIRSPLLLLLNNLGGFMMALTFILYHLLGQVLRYQSDFDIFCKVLPNNYLIFHFLFFISFCFRFYRVIKTCNVYFLKNERLKTLKANYESYLEIYYFKLLLLMLIAIVTLSFILNFEFDRYVIMPYNFERCFDNLDFSNKYVSITWIIINFIENMILITFCSIIIKSERLTRMIKTELIVFTILFILYSNILRILEKELNFFDLRGFPISIICCCFLWMFLILNFYLPLAMLFYRKYYCIVDINYELEPEHIDNLYLFLTDEYCFNSFNDYLSSNIKNDSLLKSLNSVNLNTDEIEKLDFPVMSSKKNSLNSSDPEKSRRQLIENKNNSISNESNKCNIVFDNLDLNLIRERNLLLLNIYTKIQSFRLYFTTEEDYSKVYDYTKKMCLKYFQNPDKLIKPCFSNEVLNELNDTVVRILQNGEVYLESFDCILIVCYNILKKEFEKFKKTKKFHTMRKRFERSSLIKDILINVGLINK